MDSKFKDQPNIIPYSFLFNASEIEGTLMFYCQNCQLFTKWSHGTMLYKSLLSHTLIEKLITIFLDKRTPKEAENILSYYFVDQKTS